MMYAWISSAGELSDVAIGPIKMIDNFLCLSRKLQRLVSHAISTRHIT